MADLTKTAVALGKSPRKLDNEASIETLIPAEIRDVLGEPPLLASDKLAVQNSPTEFLKKSSLFGSSPLIEGEDARQYDELQTRFSATIKPKDFRTSFECAVLRQDC